jgi:predicted DNA-binding protein with PD1-like motif
VNARVLRDEPDRTWILVFEHGDEVMEGLTAFAREGGIRGGRVWGIGALEDVVFGFYRSEKRDYDRSALTEELELLSLNGNITTTAKGPRTHVHVVVGRGDGTAHGGHLFEAHVGPTLEAFVVESPSEIRREMNERFGLPLIRL